VNEAEILSDAYERVRGLVHDILGGLTADQLTWRADAEANTVAWLFWHLTRVQDDHVADVAGIEQLWTGAGWMDRFGLPFDPTAIGYGHRSDEVAQVTVDPELLVAYHDAVCDRTLGYLASIGPDDLDRVVDKRWDPPVTLGVRLVSVVEDSFQHAGQAAFVKGLVQRAGSG
jgi:hypothetical protein